MSQILDVGIAKGLLTTRGDIIVRDATAPIRLALGAVGKKLVSDGTDVVYSLQGYPKGHMEGLRLVYVSATGVTVKAGSCRDSTDAYDIVLAADTSLSITTIAAINGLDETTLTATATTHATATFEPSASIYAETAMSSTVRNITSGTITGASTSITGTGTKFLTEVAIGDVLRSVAKGAARITAIASNTSLTIAAAFPGGNPLDEVGQLTVYEALIVRIASETPQRVNTVSHNGLSVVVPSAWTSNTSGVAIKVGGEIASCWYYSWVVSGGSGIGTIFSTQRTTPYGVTGYTTSRRRIGSVRNNTSSDINTFVLTQSGANSEVAWYGDFSAAGFFNLVSGGTATTNTAVSVDVGAPPTAVAVLLHAEVYNSSPNPMVESQQINIRSSFDTTTSNFALTVFADTQTGSDGYSGSTTGWIPMDGTRQIINWNLVSVDANTPVYMGAAGYREIL